MSCDPRRVATVALAFLALGAGPLRAQTYTCLLSPADSEWAGTCTSPSDETLAVDMRHMPEIGRYAWVGALTINDIGPLEFDLAPPASGETGVVRTPFGWLVVEEWAESVDELRLRFTLGNEVPPGADDLRILDRAIEILSNPAVWDREDDRVCEPSDRTWSLYCALVAATIDVTGGAQHRQPALQIVRRVVGDVGAERIVNHRLMSYNNHPDTTFDDIRTVIEMARERALREAGWGAIRPI